MNAPRAGGGPGHPVRSAILGTMERLHAPVSSSVLVVELGEPRSVVNYHLRCLWEEGRIACDHTDHRGGHVEHFYRLADASP